MSNQSSIFGYIGDYQRFYIHYDSIVPDGHDVLLYHVYGKTKVRNNICSYQGTVKLLGVKELGAYHRAEEEADDSYKNEIVRFELMSEWHLEEERSQVGAGFIHGQMNSAFYLDGDEPRYDDLESTVSDGYCNNQFVGSWTSWKTKAVKKCCWGNYRIPDCGDLDIGAFEFSPNPKYRDKGWASFIDAVKDGSEEKWEEESKEWW